MTEIKELNIDNIEEIEALFFEIFSNEPWNDDGATLYSSEDTLPI